MTTSVRDAATADLDAATLYRILALRVDVFVVEQECPYPELDGRDLEPGTRQLWIADGDTVLATLRLLRDPSGESRIGRVATLPAARGAGLGELLMRRAIELSEQNVIVLDAQAYLVDWYVRFGFEVAGAEYLEDGIAHVPMRRSVQ